MFAPANVAQFSLSIPSFDNDFKVLAFEGLETLNSLYAIDVQLVSEDPDIDLESLLIRPAFLQFGLGGEGLHGLIENVKVLHAGRRLTRYQISLVPRLHYLQFAHNQRIFQNMTVPKIIAEVLRGHGILSNFYRMHAQDSVAREYCTQYGQNDFEFVQRLCAEDGIAWHYQHSQDGHVMVFTDDQTYFPRLDQTPYHRDSGMVAERPVVRQFTQGFGTRARQVTRRDYKFQDPWLLMEGQAAAVCEPAIEDYRYGSPMAMLDHGKPMARRELERLRLDYQVAEGQSDQAQLRSGHFLDLTDHPRQACNDLWLLLGVHHEGKQPQVLEEAIDSNLTSAHGFTQGYRNTFTASPWRAIYRPPPGSPKPLLVSQTARVTGPPGEEIFCDEFGRVRIELHWDRAELNSEKSSCWVRVASDWAGEHFGSVTIPRVGMEVVVTYLEGDCDRPLITGCVPNAKNAVPYPLPANKTKTVLRSHSSPHTGGYSELSIEDRAGQEKVYLRAQRDLEQRVLNDSDTTIQNDRREHINRDSRSLVDNDRFEQVSRNSESLIKGDETRTTEGMRQTMVNGNDLISISGNSSTTADGTLVIKAGAQAHVSATNVVISAGISLTFQAGGQHIVICPAGIFSSVPIMPGGAPIPGQPATPAMAVGAVAMEVLSADILGAQIQALESGAVRCEVCEHAAPEGQPV